ncbi:MAG TPA: class I adenylate-forming enzyme family protein [Acidimicrobiales bacterium]|jgi:acyl-CoA synthetase (AMP-forming)/AMP-acid ligase II|nr:class I adenylate-forming enzyme family protein [Acidimicrobiales bacterium]
MSLAPDLETACRQWADRPAITFHGVTTTYGELWEKASNLARAYLAMGLEKGDRVVCQFPNTPEHVVAIAAAWAAGIVHVGTDNDLTGPELVRLVDQVGAAALLFQPRPDADLTPLEAVHRERPEVRAVVHGADLGEREGAGGLLRLADLLAGTVLESGSAKLPAAAGPSEVAVLLLTSGTTGKSKAVMESRSECWAKMQFFADAFRPGPSEVHLVFLPIAHVFGLRLALIALLTGGRLVLLDRFTPTVALGLVAEEGVTVLPGMPTHLTLILAALDPERHDVRSLRWAVSAATALPAPVAAGVYDRLGVEMLYVFGCAEGFTTRTTDRSEILAGSVGSTVFEGPEGTAPDGTVAIVDPADNQRLPAGEVGEICFGARCPVEYWGDPPTATDGWYHTGDLGRLDADGRLYVVGRLKELVNRGGLKVAPSEIEAAIVRHPGVLDAGVVATPDPVLGEAICACIVPAGAGHGLPDLGELRAFVGATLARHKLPDEVCVIDKIPRTKIGKVDRPVLTALVVDANIPRQRWRPR